MPRLVVLRGLVSMMPVRPHRLDFSVTSESIGSDVAELPRLYAYVCVSTRDGSMPSLNTAARTTMVRRTFSGSVYTLPLVWVGSE